MPQQDLLKSEGGGAVGVWRPIRDLKAKVVSVEAACHRGHAVKFQVGDVWNDGTVKDGIVCAASCDLGRGGFRLLGWHLILKER